MDCELCLSLLGCFELGVGPLTLSLYSVPMWQHVLMSFAVMVMYTMAKSDLAPNDSHFTPPAIKFIQQSLKTEIQNLTHNVRGC